MRRSGQISMSDMCDSVNNLEIMYLTASENNTEPPRGKTNNVVSDQVRHKPTCTVTEKS